jgi:hypothetical protein
MTESGVKVREEAFEKHCRPHVHNRQIGPVQRLLGEPVELVLRARSSFKRKKQQMEIVEHGRRVAGLGEQVNM